VPRVLIVDDEENQRRTLSIGLKLEGFDVLVAGSSQEALKVLSSAVPAVTAGGTPHPRSSWR
jgi:CheY-like chemotaxis protein